MRYLTKDNIPLLYWWKIQDTGNYIYLVKGANHRDVDHSEKSQKEYGLICDDIINTYGVSTDYMAILKKQQRYIIMANEALAVDDKHKLWKAKKLLAEINKELNKESKDQRRSNLILISKFVYGSPVHPMKLTLDQYHSHMEFVSEMIQDQKTAQKSHG